ncbi:hypothetical protein CASFOL_021164 [Castilleja foliolosa]|uniref:RING-type domain-containing protein n=1 Tax=Castilleja foliolosa TaxID=1961234 RepID=A0ABD3CVR8_9LAMI
MAFALRQKIINRSSSCPICLTFFKQVTTINGCCHQFCFNCIKKKITEEGLRTCPVCNVDLGHDPIQKLRYSEVSQHESSNEVVITHKDDEDDDDDQTGKAFTDNLSRNEKQKNPAEGSSANLNVPKKSTVDDKNVEHDKKVDSFWFALVASDKQKSKEPLEQIPSRYLRVKDGNITVSSIKKYLVQKLNLSSENEVEISLQGRELHPTLQVYKLSDLWLHRTTPSKTKRVFVGCSAKDFVLTLTYSRKA